MWIDEACPTRRRAGARERRSLPEAVAARGSRAVTAALLLERRHTGGVVERFSSTTVTSDGIIARQASSPAPRRALPEDARRVAPDVRRPVGCTTRDRPPAGARGSVAQLLRAGRRRTTRSGRGGAVRRRAAAAPECRARRRPPPTAARPRRRRRRRASTAATRRRRRPGATIGRSSGSSGALRSAAVTRSTSSANSRQAAQRARCASSSARSSSESSPSRRSDAHSRARSQMAGCGVHRHIVRFRRCFTPLVRPAEIAESHNELYRSSTATPRG